MDKNFIVALVAIVIAIGGYFFPHVAGTLLGGTTNYDTIGITGLQLGSGCGSNGGTCVGSTVSGFNFGTCNLDSGAGTIAAFQTKTFDCGGGSLGETALTGITAGDNVSITMPTTTPASVNSVAITGVAASSTTGFITISFTNGSSSAVTLPITATSSLQYRAYR